MITTRSLCKTFTHGPDRIVALDHVDVDIPVGQLFCLFGASGSGKSTLLNVLGGLLKPDSGDVVIDGNQITGMSTAQLAQMRLENVGVVYQDHGLIDFLTIGENVEVPLRARDVTASAAQEQAGLMCARLGIEQLMNRLPHELSGGQRQRAGIARALVGGRKVLLADEPTGALDRRNSENLFRVLRDLAAEGAAILVATHDPLAAQFAHRTAHIEDGRVQLDVEMATRSGGSA